MVTAQALQSAGLEAVARAEAGQLGSQGEGGVLPGAHAHVQTVAFREHPTVAARQPAQVQPDELPPALRHAIRIRHVSLQRHRNLRLRPRARIAADDPVRPVGADEGARGVGAAFRANRNAGGQA